MRILTIKNALKEKKVWFRVTPEQTVAINKSLGTSWCNAIAVATSIGACNEKLIYSFWIKEKGLLESLETNFQGLEEIKIIDCVPFKTQKEVWGFLVSNEGNTVEHINSKECLMTFKVGMLYDLQQAELSFECFDDPNYWKPSNYLYKPKEWWEDRINTGTLCWYGDTLLDDKPTILGVITPSRNSSGKVDFTSGGINSWRYAVPATEEDIKDFLYTNKQ